MTTTSQTERDLVAPPPTSRSRWPFLLAAVVLACTLVVVGIDRLRAPAVDQGEKVTPRDTTQEIHDAFIAVEKTAYFVGAKGTITFSTTETEDKWLWDIFSGRAVSVSAAGLAYAQTDLSAISKTYVIQRIDRETLIKVTLPYSQIKIVSVDHTKVSFEGAERGLFDMFNDFFSPDAANDHMKRAYKTLDEGLRSVAMTSNLRQTADQSITEFLGKTFKKYGTVEVSFA